MTMKRTLLMIAFLMACSPNHNASAAPEIEPGPPQICLDMPDFRCVFRWVFMEKCLRCHHANGFQGGFDAAVYKEVMKLVTPCKPDESELYGIIRFRLMPPKEEPPVTREELAMIKLWIEQGAIESNDPPTPRRRRKYRNPQPLPEPFKPECSPFNP